GGGADVSRDTGADGGGVGQDAWPARRRASRTNNPCGAERHPVAGALRRIEDPDRGGGAERERRNRDAKPDRAARSPFRFRPLPLAVQKGCGGGRGRSASTAAGGAVRQRGGDADMAQVA